MSIRLNVDSFKDADKLCSVHLLPCRIDSVGPAKVDQYFEPSIRAADSNADGPLKAAFRGRPLEG